MTAPGHLLREDLSRKSRKPPNPCPRGAVTCTVARVRAGRRARNTFHMLWHVGKRGDFFFNLSLKFTPTESRTQDLSSAAEAI